MTSLTLYWLFARAALLSFTGFATVPIVRDALVIDHHLLNLHHVRDLPVHVPIYDWVFLGLGGVGLQAIGWRLMRRSRTSVA